jgi:hypothetical protein
VDKNDNGASRSKARVNMLLMYVQSSLGAAQVSTTHAMVINCRNCLFCSDERLTHILLIGIL